MPDPVSTTTIGRVKAMLPTRQRVVTKADFPAQPIDMPTVAQQAVDVGTCPTVDYWGSTDTSGSMITFQFALFDESKNPIGLTQPLSLSAGAGRNSASGFVGDWPGRVDVGSARFVAPVIRDVTAGTWTFCWRPYGWLKFPA